MEKIQKLKFCLEFALSCKYISEAIYQNLFQSLELENLNYMI
jgi:hypothetical protein